MCLRLEGSSVKSLNDFFDVVECFVGSDDLCHANLVLGKGRFARVAGQFGVQRIPLKGFSRGGNTPKKHDQGILDFSAVRLSWVVGLEDREGLGRFFGTAGCPQNCAILRALSCGWQWCRLENARI